MCAKLKQEAQNPLILRCHRLMEAFAKSDDERDFYIDRLEGFLLYADLDKSEDELESLAKELEQNKDRYCKIPKLSYYETKKIMEGFVNEKVYDIDTKEKLLDTIQSKEARENFLEFIYDHHTEQEKWQQFYQERSRIRIIEWLRLNHFHFVFEEDLELPRQLMEKLKQFLFQPKASKDILNARKTLVAKAKTYYSSEALNPRPKRGRPPKQAAKLEIEPQVAVDIYTTIPLVVRPFLFSPDINTSSAFSIFSSKFDSEEELLSNRRSLVTDSDASLNLKLASLRSISSKWVDPSSVKNESEGLRQTIDDPFDDSFDDDDFDEPVPLKNKSKQPNQTKAKLTKKMAVPKTSSVKTSAASKAPAKAAKPKAKRIMPKITPAKKIIPKKIKTK